MDLATVHSLFDVLGDDRFDLLYSGRFIDEHSAGLITLGEEALIARNGERAHTQRLGFVMVEAYQNIVRHRATLPASLTQGTGRCLFLLRSNDTGEEVVAIDPVVEREAQALDAAVERIGVLDLKQLKALFLDRLSDGSRSERGGAGLGLIEMARRSGNGLRHRLVPLDEAHRLFVLQVTVDAPNAKPTPHVDVMRMHGMVAATDMLLMCRCTPSAAVQEAVLRILENEICDPARSAKVARAYLAAAEWLQGTGSTDADIIAVCRKEDGYSLITGARFSEEEAREWSSMVERINGLGPLERERHYRDGLLGRSTQGASFNRGLLDLARGSHVPMRTVSVAVPGGTRLLVAARSN